MRIYLNTNNRKNASMSGTTNVSKSALSNLQPFFFETRLLQNIWSKEGLLQLNNNHVFRCRIKDGKIFKTLLGVCPVTIDMSEIIQEHECHQILPGAVIENITQQVYRLSAESSVECILEYKDGTLYDWHLSIPSSVYASLTTPEDIIHQPAVKQDLLHILSLI
jgi:hypothetical protein